jgi:hypothetical protein
MRSLAIAIQRKAHMVKLQLIAQDFRQHPAMGTREPHWLLGTVYGRHLLKTKLRQVRPDLQVLMVRDQPEYEQLLESMVEMLDLRQWAKPRTLSERMHALRMILHMASTAANVQNLQDGTR